MAAASARREADVMAAVLCLQFLQLLKSPSSLLHRILPALDSANSAESVNSETTGSVSRISKTQRISFLSECYILYVVISQRCFKNKSF